LARRYTVEWRIPPAQRVKQRITYVITRLALYNKLPELSEDLRSAAQKQKNRRKTNFFMGFSGFSFDADSPVQ
jgi:hypothetical protein